MNDLSALYILSGNYEAAVETLKIAVRLSPSWAALYLNYGNALRGAGQWQEAKENLKKAQSLGSGQKGAIFNLGLLYYVADNLDGLDRLARLSEAKRLFAQYKSAMGSELSKSDQVYKYLKEVELAIDREQRRIQAEKDRADEEARRDAEREAEAAKKVGEGKDAEDKNTEEKGEKSKDEDEGWY
jgi:tetratricopeptide (TPR) repeat protein